MPTIQLRADLDSDDLIRAAEQLDTRELDELVRRMLLLRAGRFAPALSEQETAIVKRVNQAFAPEVMKRYQELIARREERTISSEELAELVRLSDSAEQLAADRATALVELSQIRRVSIDDLVNELGIRPAGNSDG